MIPQHPRSSFRPAVLATIAAACVPPAGDAAAQDTVNFPTIGRVERLADGLDDCLPDDAKIEVLAAGFTWCEGPVWDRRDGRLLFSEIPSNTVMSWSESAGLDKFLHPSGFTGVVDYGREPGSNGLLLDPEGRLISCEHGDRRVSRLSTNGGKVTLADRYDGKRFNSPNDLCRRSNGDLYVTDPPYGLPDGPDDGRRELDYCGVYRVDGKGTVTLLTKELERPNGVAFSPDERFLYVAQSDPARPIWMRYPVKKDGTLAAGTVFFDATDAARTRRGLPDGLKVDADGRPWATGPGGVWVFSPEGTPLGRIVTGEACSNVAWGDDGRTLYITSDMYLCRVRTTVYGAGWEPKGESNGEGQ